MTDRRVMGEKSLALQVVELGLSPYSALPTELSAQVCAKTSSNCRELCEPPHRRSST